MGADMAEVWSRVYAAEGEVYKLEKLLKEQNEVIVKQAKMLCGVDKLGPTPAAAVEHLKAELEEATKERDEARAYANQFEHRTYELRRERDAAIADRDANKRDAQRMGGKIGELVKERDYQAEIVQTLTKELAGVRQERDAALIDAGTFEREAQRLAKERDQLLKDSANITTYQQVCYERDTAREGWERASAKVSELKDQLKAAEQTGRAKTDLTSPPPGFYENACFERDKARKQRDERTLERDRLKRELDELKKRMRHIYRTSQLEDAPSNDPG
jgi:chromosome segregation ATPase